MSGAGQMPRPTAFTVFAGAYRAFFAGFLAFIPTLLVFCLTYFLVVLLAYQIDPSIADSAADNDSDNLSVDWLSPLTWINLVFVPCSIWWHRFVWTGETGQLWSNVFSRRGANYCLLTLVLLLGNNISIHAVGAIKDSLEWPVYAFLLCFAGVANIVIFIVSIPVFVSWAVGYRESVWVSLRHIRGNFWYCLVVHFLVFLPWLVLARIIHGGRMV
ncbi:MAG: hypothetical protein O3C34_02680 [Proteobacteria bacterium]|nr:hypothetical protein [Pseudomonadota bacterium]